MPRPAILLLACLSISAAGCAGSKDTLLPDDGHSIKHIYEQHFGDIGLNGTLAARQALNGRVVQTDAGDLSGFVRDAYHELDRHFPRLPNPTLVMYVFPHLAGDERVPIPGYATTFTLYRYTEYALPGETNNEAPRRPEGE
jgi:conjugative transfer region lipoprotein (TIGR03751 family)